MTEAGSRFAALYEQYRALPEGTKAETLEVYRREGPLWVVASTHGADAKARPEPFAAVPFDLGALFRKPG